VTPTGSVVPIRPTTVDRPPTLGVPVTDPDLDPNLDAGSRVGLLFLAELALAHLRTARPALAASPPTDEETTDEP
jgi:hypothetical protein